MKKITKASVLLLVMLLPSLSSGSAKMWLVDNTGNPNADYTTLSAALASTSVQNGDTLLLAASATAYQGNTDVSKRLVFIGPGYFLNENIVQANLNSAVIEGQLNMKTGASGSIFVGLTVQSGGGSAFYCVENISNIVIRRCRLFGANYAVYVGGVNLNGLIVAQSYIVAQLTPVQISASSGANILIENNYIRHTGSGAGVGNAVINNSTTSSLTFRHNVIEGAISVNNAFVENNIQVSPSNSVSASNSTVRNNLSAGGSSFPSGNGNQNGINMSNVFVGTGSTDGRWQLKSGSPAIGAGFNGVDCGMFGGTEPYILSGVPSVPRIIEFSAPKTGSSQSGLPIQLRVKAQN